MDIKPLNVNTKIDHSKMRFWMKLRATKCICHAMGAQVTFQFAKLYNRHKHESETR